MSYTREQFIEDVKAEAKALRVHATKDERHNLVIDELLPRHYCGCIYGQLTGNCFSERASQLIFHCCKRYFNAENDEFEALEFLTKGGDYLTMVNGMEVPGVETAIDLYRMRKGGSKEIHYSTIEAYIMIPDAKNENLIAYLRGETDTLEL